MSTNLEEVIDRIFDQLERCGCIIPSRRRAGLSPEAVKAAVQNLGLNTPDDLLRTYAYCDGTSTYEGENLAKIQFFPGFYWMSLDDALNVYSAISKSAQWNKGWLPIFANGGGDFYAVICDEASPHFGEIVGFVIGEQDQIVEFKNLTCLFRTLEHSFAVKAFFISEGRLKADYPKMRAIARQLQPGFMEHEV